MSGYIKLWRSIESSELIKDHKAFALAATIAIRARRTSGLNLHGLQAGEALLGDYAAMGMTEREYRCAKDRLAGAGYATFHATPKGTIAKLINTVVFDPNFESSDEPCDRHHDGRSDRPTTDTATGQRRTQRRLTTTNETINEKDKGTPCSPPEGESSGKFDFLELFNQVTGRKFRVLDSKTKRQLSARLKDGFSKNDFETAIKNCMADDYHRENPKYLTPEFITRADKLQKFLNAGRNHTGDDPHSFKNMTKQQLENYFGGAVPYEYGGDYVRPGNETDERVRCKKLGLDYTPPKERGPYRI